MFLKKLFSQKTAVPMHTAPTVEETPKLEPIIKKLIRNEILVKPSVMNGNLPSNASKIGGKPYLPADFVWPYYDYTEDGETRRLPLSFLCQINLADVHEYDSDDLLPKCGMLYFFYEIETMRWGFDPKDLGCARVYYYENCDGFEVKTLPTDLCEDYCVREMSLEFSRGESCPNYEEIKYHTEELGHHGDVRAKLNECEEYDANVERKGIDLGYEGHKLLGYANLLQGPAVIDCERSSRGLYSGDPDAFAKTPKNVAEDIERCASDWILLFQMGSIMDDDCELLWGDCGFLYFYIRKQDLRERKFDNIWLVLQCG